MGGEYGEVLARLASSEVYSEELVPVIKAVQKQAGMKADGVIGPRTVEALAGTSKADKIRKGAGRAGSSCAGCHRISAARVSSSTSRPLPRAIIENGEEKLKTRVVIGKTDEPDQLLLR